MSTNNGIIRLSNLARYDENIKNYISNSIKNITISSHTHTISEISDFPSSLPANGGNADTLEGLSSDDFVLSGKEQITIPDNADVPIWLRNNGKRYTIYMTTGSTHGYTNLPNNNTNYVWYVYNGNYIIALVNDEHRLYFCDTVNGVFSGWKKFAITSELSGDAYTLPTATSSVLGGVKIGSNITNTDGVISLTKTNVTNALGYTPPTNDTTYSVVSTSANGLCPKRSGTTTKFLRDDGTWAVPPDTNTTYSAATTSASGLMTAAMVTKLNGIATGATKVTIDSALSTSSTNPVQNSIVTAAINGKAASSHKQAYTASELSTYTSDSNTLGCTPAAVKKAFTIFEPKSHTHNSIDTIKGSSDRSSDAATRMYFYESTTAAANYNLPYNYVFCLRSHYRNTRIAEMAMRWEGPYPQLWARATHDSTTSAWQEIGAKIVSGSFTGNGSSMNISLSIDRPPRFVCYWNDSTGDAFIATPGTAGNFSTKTTTSGVVYKYTAII